VTTQAPIVADTLIKRAGKLVLGDVLTHIHGHPVPTQLRVPGIGNTLGHEGTATVIVLEYLDDNPASGRIKVTGMHEGTTGVVELSEREPVEVIGQTEND
jgi:hypothetical protein